MSECQTLNMSDSEQSDVTWEEFFGTTTDLMPTLLGMYDAFFDNNKNITTDVQQQQKITHSHPTKHVLNVKKSGHFTNLSPTVQKMLANISNQNENNEIVNSVSSEDSLKPRKNNSVRTSKYFENYGTYTTNRIHKISQYSTEQRNSLMLSHMNKSSECLATICDNATSNVQKMLSNIPDQDLIISNCSDSVKKLTSSNEMLSENTCKYSKSFSHTKTDNRKLQRGNSDVNHSFLYKVSNHNISDSDNLCEIEITNVSDSVNIINSSYTEDTSFNKQKPTPLSPKLSSSRSNYLQVKDGTAVGGKENEKEVSRPVSLSSLGSCSSSGSSGANQPSSIYLASTESLDSDPEPTGSQGSADSGIAENPVMSPEQRVLQEILDTENVYVTDLKQVVEGYLQIWRETPDCPLTESLPDLFSNIEEIYEFNRKFLDELYESGNDLTFVSNAFIQNDTGFRIYTEYCTHYPRIMAVLTELTQDVTKAQLIRERQVALGHALPLGSYLLKPVQRILKYHLLLHRLSKLCDPAQQESIDMALMTMTSIAGHINHMKGKHEHAVRVQEIQSQLYGWTGTDLTAMGELCAEGTFKVGGARGFRHVYLFDKVLLITKNKSDGVLAYKSHIMCSNLMLVESVRGEPLSFHVIPFDNPRLQVTLRAKSLEHKREWTLQLKRVILENYNAVIPSHARQLVMQLGQEVKIPDDISTVDKWTPLKQYSAPEYLERRSRVRKSRDLSDRRAASHDRAFASLAAWRRKSEPNVAHYNTKTLPKKISKLKKARDRGAKFYTDLSDSEACDVISESNDSLIETKSQEAEENETTLASNTLEQVVSQLLMQNQEFHRILNRQRKLIKDESTGVWLKQNVTDKPKSDSLPRSFQLNEEVSVKEPEKKPVREEVEVEKLEESVTSNNTSNTSEVNEEEDDEDMYPDHRIYRKSTIRFSLVQRFRAMISEESQRENKLPTYKQGSELMGAKIAQPDYADPQKLFSTVSSISGSQFSLDADSVKVESESLYEEIKAETKQKTNCTEAKNVKNTKLDQIDTGQCNYRSPILNKRFLCDKSIFNSSQSNDCVQKSIVENQASKLNCATKSSSLDSCNSSDSGYYEKLLEQNLHNNEEDPNRRLFRSFRESNKLSSVRECSYETARNSRNSLETRSNSVVSSNRLNMSDITESVHAAERLSRCDELPHQFPKNISFSEIQQHSSQLKSHSQSSKFIKRPLKPPPPVPAKPTRVSSLIQSSSTVVPTVTTDDTLIVPTKGWVKTVVGRFE